MSGRLLFVFLDGVGLGTADPERNPFSAARTPFIADLLGGQLTGRLEPVRESGLTFSHIDARLDTPGLPQSATGQTTLLTGRNAAATMGRHYGPWPGPTLRQELAAGNLFSEAAAGGLAAALANAYPPGYFQALERGKVRQNAPGLAATSAGIRQRDLDAWLTGQAISVDLQGDWLAGLAGSSRSPGPTGAGTDLAAIAADHDFTFLDIWLTDQAGHGGTMTEAVSLVDRLDVFLEALMNSLDSSITLVITSDHGNMEDKSVKTHTLAAVPLLAAGPGAEEFNQATAIPDVAPAIRRILGL